MGEREREWERGRLRGSQNDQLNHLPPADLKILNNLASSEFCRNYTEKKTIPLL